MSLQLSSRHPRRLLVGAAAIALVASTATTAGAAASGASSGRAARTQVRYAVDQPLCTPHPKPGTVTCFAVRRVQATARTAGAQRYVVPDVAGLGPAGGYTPDDLAIAYNYSPTTARSGQTVGIVDWFDDPNIAKDLAAFDKHYGLKKETAQSFRKVNQLGKVKPLPSSTKGKKSAGEIALDVEAVRSVCNTCRILLVEANTPSDADISAAENTAVRLGATEVSNSFGGTEGGESSTILNAFNHPGVVITASTGDDGWFDWDFSNDSGSDATSSNAPEYPASDPHVVSVGGTALGLNNNATIAEQTVWNENGLSDSVGSQHGDQGAGGGGCSTEFAAPSWQKNYPGYSSAGCGGKRLSADVSMVADPQTGFDIYDTWGDGDKGWLTIGGTSLASPVVAAMWALAGGSGGAAYPARSLYTNAALNPTSLYDVTNGGNGLCGGDTTTNCGNVVFDATQGQTHNPNALGAGSVDCSFPRDTSDPVAPPALSSECNAVAGFDGPTGLGTPNGVGLLRSTSPTVALRLPTKVSLNKPAAFAANSTEQLAGATITDITFNWGDGSKTSGVSLEASHTYTTKGVYPVVLTVTDDAGQQSVLTRYVSVGERLGLKLFGPGHAIPTHHTAKFKAEASDLNTGGKIKSIKWGWGDHHHSTGAKVSHSWKHPGRYKITVTIKDGTGVTSQYTAHQKVT